MAFKFLYTLDGSAPQTKYYPASNVTFTKGEPCYWSGGVVTNATYSNIKTHSVAGIVEETKTIASSGDPIAVQVNRNAVYSATVSDTMTTGDVGNHVLPSAIGTIASNTNADDDTGVYRIHKMISTTLVEITINFAAPSDSS